MFLIAAHDDKRGIGRDGTLPWHIEEDMHFFKEQTIGSVCVMGRKTWDSLPKRPLRDRYNIIITSQWPKFRPPQYVEKNVIVARSAEDAFEMCSHPAFDNRDKWIIGGASIYEAALALDVVEAALITHVKGDFDCDTFLPTLPRVWDLSMQEEDVKFNRLLFERRREPFISDQESMEKEHEL